MNAVVVCGQTFCKYLLLEYTLKITESEITITIGNDPFAIQSRIGVDGSVSLANVLDYFADTVKIYLDEWISGVHQMEKELARIKDEIENDLALYLGITI